MTLHSRAYSGVSCVPTNTCNGVKIHSNTHWKMENWKSCLFLSQMNAPVDRLPSQALLPLTVKYHWANTAMIQMDLQMAAVSVESTRQMEGLVENWLHLAGIVVPSPANRNSCSPCRMDVLGIEKSAGYWVSKHLPWHRFPTGHGRTKQACWMPLTGLGGGVRHPSAWHHQDCTVGFYW